MIANCVQCGGARFRRGARDSKYRVGATTYRVRVPMRVCMRCGEGYLAGNDLHQAELRVAAEIALRGPVSGETMRFMRRVLGLRAARLAELLTLRPETLSRWERGHDPVDRAAWVTVSGMVLDAAGLPRRTVERLEALLEKRRVPKLVRLDA